jgi:hypothetical protein
MSLEMDFDPDDVRANRDFFAAKPRAYKEKAAVLKKVKDGLGHDFVLLGAAIADALMCTK